MMPWAETKVWQLLPTLGETHPLIKFHQSIVILVDQLHDPVDNFMSLLPGHILCRFVLQSVELLDFLSIPVAIAIEVVQGEERARIEIANMMFLLNVVSSVRGAKRHTEGSCLTSHMPGGPVCLWIHLDGLLVSTAMSIHGRRKNDGSDADA